MILDNGGARLQRPHSRWQEVGFTSGTTGADPELNRRYLPTLVTLVLSVFLCVGVGGTSDLELPGPLSAAHEGLEDPNGCENCHDTDFNVDGNRCLACHDQIEARMRARKGVHREVTIEDCALCHAEHGGRDADLLPIDRRDFNHSVETGFALDGYHGEFAGDCSRCHTTRSYLTLESECSTCHHDAHKGTLGSDCTTCHATDAHFKNASRAFHKSTFFPLQGRHLEVPCASCHRDGMIEGTPTKCYDCHWIRRQDDPHRTRLGNECENCHQPISWTATTFNHAQFTGYPLGGQHQTVDCTGCHPDRRFDGVIIPDCFSCHQPDYEATRDPNHAAAGFPTQCDVCHRASDASWQQGQFSHGYQLVGRHAAADCSDCHSGGVYQGTPTDCVGCHLPDYQTADDPDHAAAGFPTDCEVCHRQTDASWRDATFTHTYVLAGVHTTLQCASCHSSGIYQGLPSLCVDCHRTDYDRTSSPNHQAAGFSTVCNSCHRRRDLDWHQGRYPHDAYPLVGAHRPLPCTSCHTGDVYAGLPPECVNCHLDDYNSTTDPDHPAAGFPTDCEQCHSPTGGWDDGDGGGFDHSYQLVGVHATLDCTACHASGVYNGLPSDCVDCHINDYNGTANPKHSAAGFSTACDTCHQASDPDWNRASYPHSLWPLVGTHTTLSCTSCHTAEVYVGLPSDCVDCHIADYNGTSDPNHAATGFPTDCESCHQPTTWTDADFTHGYQLVGVHATLDCSACHGGGVYAGTPTDCASCHLEDYNGSRNPNHSAAGFPTDCELCHRPSDSSWNQGVFDHFYFPITSGPHASAGCVDCHRVPSNYAVFNCLDAGCHPRSIIDEKHDEEPGYVYDSAACYSCHPDGRPPRDKSLYRMRSSHGRR